MATIKFILFVVFLMFVSTQSQFNGAYVSTQYIPPQSVGGGMISSGGYINVQNTYHAPQSIGMSMMSQGGWVQTEIKPKDPIIQAIINIASFTARGHESNNPRTVASRN